MSETKKYTASDIERYQNGQLSAAERHALEKAALDDPFLADALEGYAFAQTPSADLSTLQQRLQLRIEKKNKSHNIFYLNNWMKVAALLVLIAAGGWLMSQLFGDKKQEQLATKQSPVVQPAPDALKNSTDSTTFPANAPVTAQNEAREKENQTPHKAIRKNVIVPGAPAKQNQASDETDKKTASNSVKNEGAASGYFNTPAQGRLNDVVVSQPANEESKKLRSASAPLDTVRTLNVTLKRSELPANETVVLSKAKDRPQAKRMYVVVDSLEPAEGWTYFDDYITANLHEPEDVKTKVITGEVELQFEVNKEGQPVNITVTQSLCNQCDEEAIRLLKEGPKWKKNKKKGKVKIKFSPQQ